MVEKFDIDGLLCYTPRRFEDERGLFFESFNHKLFSEFVGQEINFVQDNESWSKSGVVRGLHLQAPPYAQGKLVRVVKGKVYDVAVDIRHNSPTYGKWVGIELSRENGKVFWIPEGFAHGFVSLEDDSVFQYKCTNYYHKDSEMAIRWDDQDLGINWQVENPVLSEKDEEAESFKDFKTPFL